MRIAIVSDIHDNLIAFEAVLADLRETSPDLILHAGDLVSGGSGPAEVVDRVVIQPPVALVHASAASASHSPTADATDEDPEATYLPLGQAIAVFGPIHQSFDGDPRASCLLLDHGTPQIRRVVYDVGSEIKAIAASGLPCSDWVVRTLRLARPQMP